MPGVKRAAVLLFVLAGCARPPSAQECDAMLDRYLDMSEPSPPPERAERIAERRASLAYLDAEKRCTRETTRAELSCAMKAPSANDWEACFDVPWAW